MQKTLFASDGWAMINRLSVAQPEILDSLENSNIDLVWKHLREHTVINFANIREQF